MNGFFGVGPLELLVIAVLALIFIGPQRLPDVIRQVMRAIRELREYAGQVQEELTSELSEVREELEGVARDVNRFADDVSQSANEIATETQQVANVTSSALSDLTPPPPPRDTTPPLPVPAAIPTNGASRDEENSRPAIADYRPE